MQWWCVATTEPWSWTWRPYPGVWLFVAAMALVYGVAVVRRDGGRPGWFALGLLLVWVALDWPVGALGAGYLASVHMVQFLLLTLIAPPFLMLGVTESSWRRWAARGGPGLRLLTHPVPTLAVFTTLVALTHWPPVVDGLMGSQLGNFLLDATWIATGILFWWPVVASAPERSWLGTPVKIGYLIAATLLNTGVFIYLTFSELPLYATFELAPPVWVTTREDQMVAGFLMKLGGAVVLWGAITILFFRWVAQEQRSEAEADVPGR